MSKKETPYIAFVDYEKAFDSVKISAVMRVLRNQGVDETYIKILEEMCSGFIATIGLHKGSDKILIKKSVRQADTISPVLFTACLEEVLRQGLKSQKRSPSSDRFAAKPMLLWPQRLCNAQIVGCWNAMRAGIPKNKRRIFRYIGQDPLSRAYYPISGKNVMVLNA